MSQDTILTLIILIGAAFLPSLVYLVWVRNSEKFRKLSWKSVSGVFLWGAIFAVIIAVILSLLFINVLSADTLQREYAPLRRLNDDNIMTLVIVCVVAPIVEEFTKVLGVFSSKGSIMELEDGLILGAASGLGFAATENLLYESSAYFQQGFQAFLMIVIVRSIASTLLHGSASAVSGYGVSKSKFTSSSAVPFYFIAVLMHGIFNYLASVQLFYGGDIPILAFIAAVIFALSAFKLVRGKIKKLDSNRRGFTHYK